MKLHQLQALLALADEGGIRAAARALDLSQAAVTKALRELETEQALTLISRHAGGARLTQAGQRLLPHARLIVSQLEKARGDLASLRGETPERLCIGITPWLGQTLLAPTVAAFRELMPGVRLELYEGLLAVSLPLLRSGRMNFSIGPAAPLPAQEFFHEPLARYPMAVVAARSHPQLGARSLGELLEQDWVVNYAATSQARLMEELFGRHGHAIAPERVLCAQSSNLLSSMIVDGGMLGYSPEPMLLCEPLRSQAQALQLAESLGEGDMSVIWLRDQALDQASLCFIDCLRRALKSCVRSPQPADRRLASMLSLQF